MTHSPQRSSKKQLPLPQTTYLNLNLNSENNARQTKRMRPKSNQSILLQGTQLTTACLLHRRMGMDITSDSGTA
jgi:hypothetical protein